MRWTSGNCTINQIGEAGVMFVTRTRPNASTRFGPCRVEVDV